MATVIWTIVNPYHYSLMVNCTRIPVNCNGNIICNIIILVIPEGASIGVRLVVCAKCCSCLHVSLKAYHSLRGEKLFQAPRTSVLLFSTESAGIPDTLLQLCKNWGYVPKWISPLKAQLNTSMLVVCCQNPLEIDLWTHISHLKWHAYVGN